MDEARPIFKEALDQGLYTFDCANVYGLGVCETVVGSLLRELVSPDQFVLSTKISARMGPGSGNLHAEVGCIDASCF